MRIPHHGSLLTVWRLRGLVYAVPAAALVFYLLPGLLHAGPTNGFELADALVPAAEIHHGGPPRDGIPAIDRPKFVTAGQANFLDPDDRVLGIARGGIHKAYPVRILNYHEIVNDRFGEESVVVSYCPLCGTGMAFLALVKGRPATFGVSGLLYNSDMLLYDRETESLWSQMMAQAVSGPLRGQHLKQVVMEHTRWEDWHRRHPDTLVLSERTGYARDYRVSPYPGYAQSKSIYFPVSRRDRRYHPKEQVIGLTLNGSHKAYPFSELSRFGRPLRDSVGGRSIQVEYDAANRTGRVLDAAGEVLPSTISYWFAWIAFHPETGVYRAP